MWLAWINSKILACWSATPKHNVLKITYLEAVVIIGNTWEKSSFSCVKTVDEGGRERVCRGKLTSKLENLSRGRVVWLMKISDWNDLGKDNKELWSSEITVLMGQTGEAVCWDGNVAHTVLCAQALVFTLLEIHVGHSFINPLECCSHYGHSTHLVVRETDRRLCSSASSSPVSSLYPPFNGCLSL